MDSYAKPAGLVTEEQLSDVVVSLGFPKPMTFSRVIDGNPAVVAKGYMYSQEVCAFTYSPDGMGKERVIGVSTIPWDSGTTQILDTLHVTRVS